MDPIFEKNLITTKDAGELSGYTSDYLARLARSGKIIGKRVGRNWLVDKESLARFLGDQEDRKVDYVRALALEREEEYRRYNSLASNVTKILSKTLPVLPLETQGSILHSHSLAAFVAFLTIASGVFVANSGMFPQLSNNISSVAKEASFGFKETFGNIPSRIASRINLASAEMNSVSPRLRRAISLAPHSFSEAGSPLFAHPDLSSLRIVIQKNSSVRSIATAQKPRSETSRPSATEIQFNAQEFVLNTFAFVSSPSLISKTLLHSYRSLGEFEYETIQKTLSSYAGLIQTSGESTLALAAYTRDTLTDVPYLVTKANIALGNAVINSTHAIIRADVSAAYGLGTALPDAGRSVIAAVLTSGNALANVTAGAPKVAKIAFLEATKAHSVIAPAIAKAVFDAEYAGASRFVAVANTVSENYLSSLRTAGRLTYSGTAGVLSLSRATGSLIANIPAVAEDTYLGILGKSALALDSFARVPKVAAVLTAVSPALSLGEKVALTTYETINDLFGSANRMFATLIGTPHQIVSPTITHTSSITTSTATTTRSSTIVTAKPSVISYPTYTTVVKGVSEDLMNESLSSLRTTILSTVAGMIQPVSYQTNTNAITIREVNRIEELHDLIVHSGDFRGGKLIGASSVTSSSGSFTTLSASTTDLAATTITGDLTVSGTIIPSIVTASTSISAPYFIATSTTATSTFAGKLAIGTTSPWGDGLLTIGTSTPLLYISSNTGFVGIGTTTPTYKLDVAGLGHFSSLVDASNFIATSSSIASVFNGGFLSASSTITRGLFTMNGGASTTNLTASGIGYFATASTTNLTVSSLIANRIPYITTDGSLIDSNNLTFNGTTFASPYASTTQLSALRSLAIGTTSTTTIMGDGNTSNIYGPLTVRGTSAQAGLLTIRRGLNNTNNTLSFTDESGTALMDIYTDANTGNARIVGYQTNLTLGTSVGGTALSIDTTHNVNVTAHLIPTANQTYSLGSAAQYWANAYINNIVANNLSSASTSIAGTNTTSFSINSNNPTGDTQDISLIFYRGAGAPSNGVLSWNSTLKRFEFNQNLYVKNATEAIASTTLSLAAVSGQTAPLTSWLDSSGSVLNTVTAGGFLGVGTSSPYSLLSISNNLNTPANTPLFTIASTTAGTATSTLLTVLANGNVGIGTTSPSQKLSTDGLMYIGGTTGTSTITANLNVQGQLKIGTGSLYLDSSSVWTGSGNLTLQPSAGNVGIGTADLNRTLSIKGTNAMIHLENSASDSGTLGIEFKHSINAGDNYTQSAIVTTATGGAAGIADMYFVLKSTQDANNWSTTNDTKMVIKNNGNVGIGTTVPTSKLQLNKTSADTVSLANSFFYFGDESLNVGLIGQQKSSGTYGFMMQVANKAASTYYPLLLNPNGGNVGIGTVAPGSLLEIKDPSSSTFVDINSVDGANTDLRFKRDGVVQWEMLSHYIAGGNDFYFRNGNTIGVYIASGDTSWSASSDIRLKTNIATIPDVLEKLNSIRGVTFNWLDPNKGTKTQIGVIAQEVQSMFPEIISTDADGYLGVQYDKLGPILIEAAKELNAKFLVPTGATSTPADVLTADGKGIDIYKLATFAVSSVQALAERIDAQDMRMVSLETRVTALESGAISAASSSSGLFATSTIASAIESFSGVLHIGQLISDTFYSARSFVDNLFAANVTVGSQTAPSGVTFYDSVTKQPYCFNITNGAPTTTPGICVGSTESTNPFATSTDSTSSTQATTATSTAPIISETPIPLTITLNGETPTRVPVGGIYIESGAVVIGGSEGTAPYQISINGLGFTSETPVLDTSIPTTYILTYHAVNTAGEHATAYRSVIVGDSESITTPPTDETPTATTTDTTIIPTIEPDTDVASTTISVDIPADTATSTIPVEIPTDTTTLTAP